MTRHTPLEPGEAAAAAEPDADLTRSWLDAVADPAALESTPVGDRTCRQIREIHAGHWSGRLNTDTDLTFAVGLLVGARAPGAAAAVIFLWQHWIQHSDADLLPREIQALLDDGDAAQHG